MNDNNELELDRDPFGDEGRNIFSSGPYEGMDELQRAQHILPAWFVTRMMTDDWHFGLMLTTGQTLCIARIDDIHQTVEGAVWLDVTMLSDNMELGHVHDRIDRPMTAPTRRLKASINAAHVVAAFELADT